MKPIISIVIPTYNRARDLERALNSVLAQTYPHWEVLVVDNHSSDNTDDIVKNFNDSRIKLFKIHNEGVIAASRNLGMKHSSGEYIAFLDSDDWWMPQKLEKSLQYLDQGADVVYHDLYLVTKPDQKIFWRKARTRALNGSILKNLLTNGNTLNNSSVLIRRTILESIGGLGEDPSLIAMEDYDFWLRAAKVTEKFIKIPKTLGYYWAVGGNYWSGGRGDAPLRKRIASLDYLEHVYADEFCRFKRGVYWLKYVKGVTYYKMGSYAMAKQHLQLVGWWRVPYFVILKTRWMLFMIHVYHNP